MPLLGAHGLFTRPPEHFAPPPRAPGRPLLWRGTHPPGAPPAVRCALDRAPTQAFAFLYFCKAHFVCLRQPAASIVALSNKMTSRDVWRASGGTEPVRRTGPAAQRRRSRQAGARPHPALRVPRWHGRRADAAGQVRRDADHPACRAPGREHVGDQPSCDSRGGERLGRTVPGPGGQAVPHPAADPRGRGTARRADPADHGDVRPQPHRLVRRRSRTAQHVVVPAARQLLLPRLRRMHPGKHSGDCRAGHADDVHTRTPV